jgi:hypothetical protein
MEGTQEARKVGKEILSLFLNTREPSLKFKALIDLRICIFFLFVSLINRK